MIDKIDKNMISDLLANITSTQNRPAKTDISKSTDASVQIDYDALLKNAIDTEQTDPSAIAKTRQLILSGQLDSDENIRSAAENILTFGI